MSQIKINSSFPKLRKMIWTAVVIFIVQFLPVGTFNAHAEPVRYINISSFLKKTPIAVTEFRLATQNKLEIEDSKKALKILKEALNFTGYLKTMNPMAFLSNPAESGVSLPEIKFKDWTGIGAELLVTGKITEDVSGQVSLELRLFDTFKNELLVANEYSQDRSMLRQMIHEFCSDVSFALTGSYGIFSSKIAFVSKNKGKKEIFTCDFDGHNVKQFTRYNSICLSPSWSSDGQWLAFVSFAKGGTKIFVEKFKGGVGTLIGFKGTNSSPDWMPGSLTLAASMTFSKDPEIYLLTREGKIIKRVTKSLGIDVSPRFSPDGKNIAFTSRRHGSPQIYVKDLNSGQVKRMTFEGRHNTSPAWSPDGKRIAYVGIEDNRIDIYLLDIRTGQTVRLTQGSGDNEDPSWSPDGSMLVFTSTRVGGIPRIFVMNASGTDQRQLISLPGRQSQPDWSLSLSAKN